MADTNNLLRFLTAEAKLPLAAAIAQAAGLQKANLVTYVSTIFFYRLSSSWLLCEPNGFTDLYFCHGRNSQS